MCTLYYVNLYLQGHMLVRIVTCVYMHQDFILYELLHVHGYWLVLVMTYDFMILLYVIKFHGYWLVLVMTYDLSECV